MPPLSDGQRLLLAMVTEAGQPLRTGRLQEDAFVLLRQEVLSEHQCYDFFPLQNKPHSAILERDIDKLIDSGWFSGSHSVSIPRARQPAVCSEIRELAAVLRTAVEKFYRRYRSSAHQERHRLQDCGRHFPWPADYLAPDTSDKEPPIYTIGYQGSSLDAFLKRLLQTRIRNLADVRDYPNSRIWGFTRSSLSRWCRRIGIVYVHLPQLGIPANLRKGIRSASDHAALLEYHRRQILPRHEESLAELEKLVSAAATVLLCMEKDPCSCHRKAIAERLGLRLGMPIVHL